MHRTKLLNFLRTLRGTIFHITWIKKNGDTSSANARLRVKQHVKGTGKAVAQPSNSYITIWKMGKNGGYRNLNLDTVRSIKSKGKTYQVNPDPITEHVDLTTTNKKVSNNVITIKT